MKTYFLDTNILLDFLANRQPFAKYALKIFDHARRDLWDIWTSSNSVTTVYYILERELGPKQAKMKIGQLLTYLHVQPITQQDLEHALQAPFKDYEDGVQHACALSHGGIDGIITRNQKDFRNSQVPIFGPEELFEDGD